MRWVKRFLSTLLVALSLHPTLTAYATGSTTKTATAETTHCDGGTSVPCPFGAGLEDASVNSNNHYACRNVRPTYTYDNNHIPVSTYWTCEKYCARCDAYATGSDTVSGYSTNLPSSIIPADSAITHKNVTVNCSHGEADAHEAPTGYYVDSTYGYRGTSETFEVWPITVTNKDGITSSIAVTGATATDAAMSGKTVSITPSGVATGTSLKITNTGTGETKMVTSGSSAYTFTMPAAVTAVTIELGVSVAATLSATSVEYHAPAPTLNVTGVYSSLSYSSSNTNVATINSSGVITTKNAGTATLTVSAS